MDFTNEEKERINYLYGNDFKDITPEDAQLIGRWEAWKATEDARYKAELKALQDEADLKMENATALYKQARNNLTELRDKALARFDKLEGAADGQ